MKIKDIKDEAAREKAIYYANLSCKTEEAVQVELIEAFIWSETEEGYEYWEKINANG